MFSKIAKIRHYLVHKTCFYHFGHIACKFNRVGVNAWQVEMCDSPKILIGPVFSFRSTERWHQENVKEPALSVVHVSLLRF